MSADAISFDGGLTWKAIAKQKLQRPDFNSRGAALAFAKAVQSNKRPAEPVVREDRKTV